MPEEIVSADGMNKLIKTERTVDDIKGESRGRPLSQEGRDQWDIIFRKKEDKDERGAGEETSQEVS